jgi:hypothetical protein
MAHRNPTDTLIVTGLPDQILDDPTPIVQFLALRKRAIELVALRRFSRILLICQSRDEASLTYADLTSWAATAGCPVRVSYSLKDNESHRSRAPLAGPAVEYLELPLEHESRRFLISPPPSPPAEWDHWHKTEEGPNKRSVYSAQELSHLLWQRLGGVDDHVHKYTEDDDAHDPDVHDILQDSEVLFKDIYNGVPAIVLDGVGEPDTAQPRPIARTAIPPPLEN